MHHRRSPSAIASFFCRLLLPVLNLDDPVASLLHKLASQAAARVARCKVARALTPTISWGNVGINPTKKRKKNRPLLRSALSLSFPNNFEPL